MEQKSFFASSRLSLALIFFLLFGIALAIRAYDITDLPLDFHPTRQLFSAVKARGMYYETLPVGTNTLTVLSKKGETFVVTVPDGFAMNTIKVGDSVLVKAVAGDNDSWLAQSIKQIGPKNAGDDTDDEQDDGSKENSAYCSDEKQGKPHPLATKLSERYGVDEGWIMRHFCAGHGMGAIMLALKTSEIDGVDLDADSLLAERENGSGWGQIWQNQGLIGNEKEGHSPPGQLKKPDHAKGPKDKDKDKD